MPALLFDLGGTFLRAGVLGLNNSICHFEKLRIENVTHGLKAGLIWEKLLQHILAYEKRSRHALAHDAPIVFSFPGPVLQRKRLMQAPTVVGSGAVHFDLAGEIESATQRRVVLLNDVSAAAWRIAETTDAVRFLVVTVSSGIGSKLFDRCHPLGVLDHPAFAGEIGHVVADDSPDAIMCDCGGRGHLGAVASGRGIERFARRYALRDPRSFHNSACCTEFYGTADSLTNEQHIVPAVIRGDPWAMDAVVTCTRPLVRSLLTVAMGAGLDRIFIMGGFASAMSDVYLGIVRKLASELCQYPVCGANIESLFEVVTSEISLEGCSAFYRCKRSEL